MGNAEKQAPCAGKPSECAVPCASLLEGGFSATRHPRRRVSPVRTHPVTKSRGSRRLTQQ